MSGLGLGVVSERILRVGIQALSVPQNLCLSSHIGQEMDKNKNKNKNKNKKQFL
jgi:hypothetical protein